LEFLINIQLVTLKSKASVNITDTELRRIRLSNLQARSLVEENEELFAEVVRLSLTKKDVVAIGYRKKQLDVFRLLLEDPAYFEDLKRRKDCTDEKLWQQFFEKNPWIFGYGLSYLYLDSLDDKKLEQVVQGHSVAARGKRVDALMKTRGGWKQPRASSPRRAIHSGRLMLAARRNSRGRQSSSVQQMRASICAIARAIDATGR
jgi:hypothetical protein